MSTRLKDITVFSFFILIFFYFSNPILVITDFWWHIATGRWITMNAALPSADPFLFTSKPDPSVRIDVILTGYWLAQMVFFMLHKLLGFYGILLLKASVLVSIYIIIWRALVKKGYEQITALAFIIPLVFLSQSFSNPRPQLFSFLGMAVTLYLLEDMKERIINAAPPSSRILFLPLVMLLWANMHPGFIMGSAVILLYGIMLFIHSRYDRNIRAGVYPLGVLAASVAAAAINPNGYNVILMMLKESDLGAAAFAGTITEYLPALKYYLSVDNTPLAILLGFYLTGMSLLFFRGWNRRRIFSTLLFVSFLAVGLKSFRYIIFFHIAAPLLLPSLETSHRKAAFLTLLSKTAVVSMLLFLVFMSRFSPFFTGEPVSDAEARGMVAYMKNRNVPAVIFNPYEWGGYMEWHLYPKQKLFIDARTLEIEIYDDYRKAVGGKKQEVFGRYGIDHVCFYLSAPTMKLTPSLIYSLLKDNGWALEYSDDHAAVFAKARTSAAEFTSKAAFMERRIRHHLNSARLNPSDIRNYKELGQLFYVKGDHAAAIGYFQAARKIDPKDDFVRKWLEVLGG